MVIKALFIGTNSLGYEKGKEYFLYILKTEKIMIERLDGTGICQYESLVSFLKNWDNINRVKKHNYDHIKKT